MEVNNSEKMIKMNPLVLVEHTVDWNLLAICSVWIFLILTFACIFI